MSLLLDTPALEARRRAAAGPLAPLAASLASDLRPVIAADLHLPADKARLSRAGGRCPTDGTTLDFDPFSPRAHRCPSCGRVYDDDAHYRSWITWYQLWLAERSVHAAVLHLLTGEPGCGAFADRVLAECAERYLAYPNRDNVLGPTRPFFSTYLESIWLLQIAVALDLRETSGDAPAALGPAVRDRVLMPSASLVASFDEGSSNRQVWNDAALLAAGRLLDDRHLVDRALHSGSGLVTQLERGLLSDGTWYEGDNYHQFAHRGLWYGVALAEAAGREVPPALLARYASGFGAPFASALPDFTFPARRDSQYAVSLRQWRFAEMAELGLARGESETLVGALQELYETPHPRSDTGRARSSAEAERNAPPTSLTRADLGWRSLLFARETLPALHPAPRRSLLLEGQGLAIFRREAGSVYAALDYGASGGGHGHPDRLNVLLSRGATRWLDDPGTGSYVDPSLHWYRSTLAHCAPLVDGRSQQRTEGTLRAHDERGGAGWVDAEARIAPGVVARRVLVVMPDYHVDRLEWRAERDVTLDLPLHADGELEGIEGWRGAPLEGGSGLEDGFEHVTDADCAVHAAQRSVLRARRGGESADVFLLGDPAVEWWRAEGPGPPGNARRRFHLARQRGACGRLTAVWSWAGAVADVRCEREAIVVRLRDGSRHEHREQVEGWGVSLYAGGAATSIHLDGRRVAPATGSATVGTTLSPALPAVVPRGRTGERARALHFRLGREHYRRSEATWEEAGAPAALVALWAEEDRLRVDVTVASSALLFAPADAANEMDNEHPDVNGDGVQLYLASDAHLYGWRLVPEAGGAAVRVGEVRGMGGGTAPTARWRRAGTGYVVECALELPPSALAEMPFGLDVVVNETAPGRERRRGQLVLSGARGEFVYLRGDRQPADRALPFVIEPDASRTHV